MKITLHIERSQPEPSFFDQLVQGVLGSLGAAKGAEILIGWWNRFQARHDDVPTSDAEKAKVDDVVERMRRGQSTEDIVSDLQKTDAANDAIKRADELHREHVNDLRRTHLEVHRDLTATEIASLRQRIRDSLEAGGYQIPDDNTIGRIIGEVRSDTQIRAIRPTSS